MLDVILPDADGFAVCDELRADGSWAPILMLTALDDVQDRVRGLNAGADDYLVKPFDLAELVARLHALFRRGAAPRPVTLRVGDLSLDPARREVRRGGQPIELTAREFSLLEYLMRRSGSVVSKAELLAHVWDDPDEIADLNVVEVYVGYLRRKIDAPFGRKSVQTVRGAGYLLADDGG